ncbi:MAG: serine/threonine protein kinase [Kofleriaceae bacterium]|nr:serine/threonine protein kinase [Kofleriaceae bacterium]
MTISSGTIITHGLAEYKVLDKIDSGGFGVVYLAERLKPFPKKVAIKVPAEHILSHPVWSKKFVREARILGNIRHRNVVKIIAFMEFSDGQKALVQELVRGAVSLSLAVKQDPSQAPSYFLQALYAIRACHGEGGSAGAIHRDLSPSNILIGEDGILKVIDFGLAKEDPRLTEKLTQAQEWFGTPGCMSPEQYDGSAEVNHRTDLFALGRSFAAAIQGRTTLHAKPESLAEPWSLLCSKLAEHEVGDRYQSATEALDAAFMAFADYNINIGSMGIHVEEIAKHPLPNDVAWSRFCAAYFANQVGYSTQDLYWLAQISPAVFISTHVDANHLLDTLEQSAGVAGVAVGDGFFDDADPLGTLYRRLYPALSTTSKLTCFTRLCEIAIARHRYHVMGCVRAAYGKETNSATLLQLMQILDKVDPTSIIEGRGVIPRTP